MIIVGDADAVKLEHALKLFKLRGGIDIEVSTKGFMTEPPQVRFAILPATSHIGMMTWADLIETLVTPFLNDEVPPLPKGFF